MSDDAAIQLLKDFKARFSHYPAKQGLAKTKQELIAAKALLHTATKERILDLAAQALADRFLGNRSAAATLTNLCKNWAELAAQFPPSPPKPEFKAKWVTGGGEKSEAEIQADKEEYFAYCKSVGADPSDQSWRLKTSQDAPGLFRGYPHSAPPPLTGKGKAAG